MARAKRTDRAEARRRYRATVIDSDQSTDTELEPAEPEATGGRASRARSSGPVAPPQRPSVVAAFRGSFRPIDLRGDIAAIPMLLRHRAFLVPVLLVVAVTGLLIATGGTDVVSRLVSPYFLAPPPIAPIFVAGFLAPRASWIIGILIGIIASVALAVVVATPGFQVALQQPAGSVALTPGVILLESLPVSILGGAVFAAAAAGYKRFLTLANPNRAARPTKPGDRNRRRDSNNRPLLARRR